MLPKPLSKTELRKTKLSREKFIKMPRNPIYIALDSLKSAHNIATIIRLADAVLAEKVFICGNSINVSTAASVMLYDWLKFYKEIQINH